MRVTPQTLLVVLLGLLAWLPADDGGGGDTGVWILPRSRCLSGSTVLVQPISTRSFSTLDRPVSLTVSAEMGSPMGTLVMPTGAIVPLPVRGLTVDIPASLLQALAAANVTSVRGLIVDQSGRGYEFTLQIDPVQRSGSISVY